MRVKRNRPKVNHSSQRVNLVKRIECLTNSLDWKKAKNINRSESCFHGTPKFSSSINLYMAAASAQDFLTSSFSPPLVKGDSGGFKIPLFLPLRKGEVWIKDKSADKISDSQENKPGGE